MIAGDLTLWKRFTELIATPNNIHKDAISIARELKCGTKDVLDMVRLMPMYYNKSYTPEQMAISYKKGGMLITKESVRTDHSDVDFSKWNIGEVRDFEMGSPYLAKQKQRIAFAKCRDRHKDIVHFKIKTSISAKTLTVKLIAKY